MMGWQWTECGSTIALDESGLEATFVQHGKVQDAKLKLQLVTDSELMTDGRHYWEAQITGKQRGRGTGILLGAVRPGLDHDDMLATLTAPLSTMGSEATATKSPVGTHFYLMDLAGCLFKDTKDLQDLIDPHLSRFPVHGSRSCRSGDILQILRQGDRVGCLLDLDEGWMQFYCNGVRHGPGFTEGVVGPLVRAAILRSDGDMLTALPGAKAPQVID